MVVAKERSKPDPLQPQGTNDTPKVIVVGGGLAGLVAAIEAYRQNAHVTLIEKEKSMGGNSAKATSGINGAVTAYQETMGIDDSIDLFIEDTCRAGHHTNAPGLVQVLAAQSATAIDWLTPFNLHLTKLVQCGGHRAARTHREADRDDGKPAPIGWDLVSALRAYLMQTCDPSRVCLLSNARVTALLQDRQERGQPVRGVRYTDLATGTCHSRDADAVVLATGGYGYARGEGSWLHTYAPDKACLATTNGAHATGDGLGLATAVGARLVDMDKVQVHPTAFVLPSDPRASVKWLAPEALRGHGGLLLTPRGERFCDELAPRDRLTDRLFAACASVDTADAMPVACLVLNGEAVAAVGAASVAFYVRQGRMQQVGRGVARLVAFLVGDTMPPFPVSKASPASCESTLRATLASYNASARGEAPDVFGKTVFPCTYRADDDDFYVAWVTPSIHYTMGGVHVNPAAEVLRPVGRATRDALGVLQEEPVPGLYAAGEVTGGVHGANRLAGNSLLECVVFGRIAGRRAANLRRSLAPALCPTAFRPLTLRERIDVCPSTKVFRFNLPSTLSTTGLILGQYVNVRAVIDGQDVVRSYSPMSRPDALGYLDLCIKVDATAGAMSSFLGRMKSGETLDIKGPMGGLAFDLAAPGPIKHIYMVCGGTGIAPMVQILRSVLYHHRHDLNLTLLYGTTTVEELVFKEILEEKARNHENFNVEFFLEKPPKEWPYHTGFINKESIQKFMFSPQGDSSSYIVLCGPYAMCQALKQTFKELGYSKEQYYSFM